MKYFITGATGFIGGRVAQQLVTAGHEVIALVRSRSKAQDLAKLGISLVEGDITDKESMRQPMTAVDGVFHIAAWYKIGERDKSIAERINVEGTRNVLELMKELGIPKGVYTSTVAVNSNTDGKVVDERYRFTGQHLSEYDRTKWRAHYEVAVPMIEAGLPLVIVQPGVTYGPGDTSAIAEVLKQYVDGKLPMVPDKTAYCWAHVEDIARGHIQAMEQGKVGESYFLTGPVHSLFDALQIAESITGIKAPRLKAAPGMLLALSSLMSLVEKVIPISGQYSSETLRVSAGATYLGSSVKAERELGFTARSLAEGLTETLGALMKS